jgi:N-acetyltransferase
MVNLQPVTLTGRGVRLEPLAETHVADLAAVGLDERIWKHMLYGDLRTEAQLRGWVQDILGRQARGTDLAFAVIDLSTGRAIGGTRYLEIRPEHRGLEIGGTWYGLAYQGTAVNPECKYLLMRHAFETLGMLRVQFKADLRNTHSQRAIERLGAVKEGVLRDHLITPSGYIRSSVYYSVLAAEWPAIKTRLEARLQGLLPESL